VGYAGGSTANPTYHALGDHSETVQFDYDPARISYAALLAIFWKDHDPTAASWSKQYRAAIFYHSELQKQAAFDSKEQVAAVLKTIIRTAIVPFPAFYSAEDYHQKHALQHNPELMREFKAMYVSFERIVNSTAAARVNGYLAGYGTFRQLQEEIESYGLSRAGGEQLIAILKRSSRFHCAGSSCRTQE
jgi:peptide-methionine (S)-S-oxide reductase